MFHPVRNLHPKRGRQEGVSPGRARVRMKTPLRWAQVEDYSRKVSQKRVDRVLNIRDYTERRCTLPLEIWDESVVHT